MRSKSGPHSAAESQVREIRRQTRKRYSSEEKIRIVLEGLRGEYSIAELCRREGIAQGLYDKWSKEFLEAGKKRLSADTERQATSGEVKDLRREMSDLKEAFADVLLENRLLKKTYGPSPLQGVLSDGRRTVCVNVYDVSIVTLSPRWIVAQPGPHKHDGFQEPFF